MSKQSLHIKHLNKIRLSVGNYSLHDMDLSVCSVKSETNTY